MMTGLLLSGPARAATDGLAAGFAAPPPAAKPQLWWHWLDGNVSYEGAVLDLDWMKRIGIGGAQVFETGAEAARTVAQPLEYMSPEWRKALRYSIWHAARNGIDISIGTAPGLGGTGGAAVTAAQSMKKLVWTETAVAGGARVSVALPRPSAVPGPYQDLPAYDDAGKLERNAFYRDAVVVAYRRPATDQALQPLAVAGGCGDLADGRLLRDGQYGAALTVSCQDGAPAWVRYEFATPAAVQATTVAFGGPATRPAALQPEAVLEASDDGLAWRAIADLRAPLPAAGPWPVRSATFAPVQARFFRLLLRPHGAGAGAPAALSEWQLHAAARVHQSERKSGHFVAPDYYAIATPASADASAVASADVIDLSAHMRADGMLDWQAPAGNWVVLRLGYSSTGQENAGAPASATGLEVDKLNVVHVNDYLNDYISSYRDLTGRDYLGNKGIRGLVFGNRAGAAQNWTDDMPQQFRRLRGYDLTPWLPALTGVVVQSAAATDRFLWDFRRTLAQLLATAHFRTLAQAARANGLTTWVEALADGGPQLGDDMEMRRYADIPLGAMALWPADPAREGGFVADLRAAASVAHIYGKPRVAAEAFTSPLEQWGVAPRDLRPAADLMLALGVNRFVINGSPHQPAVAGARGPYFTRNDTWSELAGPWISYLVRSSWLLQQGTYHADFAYFHGEGAPLTQLFGSSSPAELPEGYSYDFVNGDALLTQFSVRDGHLQTLGGMRYRLLYLGGSSRYMTLAVLQKLQALAAAGAVIVGARPLASPSLADDAAAFRRLADELWSDGSRAAGRVLGNISLTQAFAQLGVPRDWSFAGQAMPARLAVLHRRLDPGEIYFVSNREARAIAGEITLRVSGRVPELWHADSGEREPASYRMGNGATHVPLRLGPGESVFIVLREATAQLARTLPARTETPRVLAGEWQLAFSGAADRPEARVLRELHSWSDAADEPAQRFSGTGIYSRAFAISAAELAASALWLDLGDVREVAEVIVNGRSAGIVWKPPYRLDIRPLLRAGSNQLQIRVTSLQGEPPGDGAPAGAGDGAVAAKTAVAPQRPAGLLGPVSLVSVGPR